MVDASGTISTVAGNGGATGNGDGGPPDSANIRPADIAFDAAGNYYIADFGHNSIRKVTLGAKVPGLLTSAGALYFSTAANGNNSPGSQKVTVYTKGDRSAELHCIGLDVVWRQLAEYAHQRGQDFGRDHDLHRQPPFGRFVPGRRRSYACGDRPASRKDPGYPQRQRFAAGSGPSLPVL